MSNRRPIRRFFQRCAANTSSRRASNPEYTKLDIKRKVILKPDAIPTTFPASGKS